MLQNCFKDASEMLQKCDENAQGEECDGESIETERWVPIIYRLTIDCSTLRPMRCEGEEDWCTPWRSSSTDEIDRWAPPIDHRLIFSAPALTDRQAINFGLSSGGDYSTDGGNKQQKQKQKQKQQKKSSFYVCVWVWRCFMYLNPFCEPFMVQCQTLFLAFQKNQNENDPTCTNTDLSP